MWMLARRPRRYFCIRVQRRTLSHIERNPHVVIVFIHFDPCYNAANLHGLPKTGGTTTIKHPVCYVAD